MADIEKLKEVMDVLYDARLKNDYVNNESSLLEHVSIDMFESYRFMLDKQGIKCSESEAKDMFSKYLTDKAEQQSDPEWKVGGQHYNNLMERLDFESFAAKQEVADQQAPKEEYQPEDDNTNKKKKAKKDEAYDEDVDDTKTEKNNDVGEEDDEDDENTEKGKKKKRPETEFDRLAKQGYLTKKEAEQGNAISELITSMKGINRQMYDMHTLADFISDSKHGFGKAGRQVARELREAELRSVRVQKRLVNANTMIHEIAGRRISPENYGKDIPFEANITTNSSRRKPSVSSIFNGMVSIITGNRFVSAIRDKIEIAMQNREAHMDKTDAEVSADYCDSVSEEKEPVRVSNKFVNFMNAMAAKSKQVFEKATGIDKVRDEAVETDEDDVDDEYGIPEEDGNDIPEGGMYDVEIDYDTSYDLESEVEAASKTETKAEVKEESKAETKEESKAEVKEEPKAETKEEPKAEAKEEPKAEVKEEPKAEAKEELKAEAKEEPKAEAKEEPKAEAKEEPKAEAKEEPKAETKEEPKAEAKEEPKAEAKEEPKAEAKEEPKAEAKEEPKAEVKEKLKADENVAPEVKAESKDVSERAAKILNKATIQVEQKPAQPVKRVNTKNAAFDKYLEESDKNDGHGGDGNDGPNGPGE